MQCRKIANRLDAHSPFHTGARSSVLSNPSLEFSIYTLPRVRSLSACLGIISAGLSNRSHVCTRNVQRSYCQRFHHLTDLVLRLLHSHRRGTCDLHKQTTVTIWHLSILCKVLSSDHEFRSSFLPM